MGNYEITKTLNNNVLICKSNNHEVVLIGKGIGFNKKVGMMLDVIINESEIVYLAIHIHHFEAQIKIE